MSPEHGDEERSRPRISEGKTELDGMFDLLERRQAGANPIRGVFRSASLTFCARPREERLDLPKLGNELLFLVGHTAPASIVEKFLSG